MRSATKNRVSYILGENTVRQARAATTVARTDSSYWPEPHNQLTMAIIPTPLEKSTRQTRARSTKCVFWYTLRPYKHHNEHPNAVQRHKNQYIQNKYVLCIMRVRQFARVARQAVVGGIEASHVEVGVTVLATHGELDVRRTGVFGGHAEPVARGRGQGEFALGRLPVDEDDAARGVLAVGRGCNKLHKQAYMHAEDGTHAIRTFAIIVPDGKLKRLLG